MATLLNITSQEELDFIGWWLNDVSVQGYIWTIGDTDSAHDMCTELYKDSGVWSRRFVTCQLRNHFICQYG